MKVDCIVWKAGLMAAGCILLTLPPVFAQKAPAANAAANSAATERASLVDKAHALEARGRPDLAAQLWQQILLSAPDNVEALEGMARAYKLMGNADQAGQALDRLRRVSPSDPNIARIESMASASVASDKLRQAGELARQGKNEDAMRIYRQLYGSQPPEEIALAYYETLYGTAGGKQDALAGMRDLAERNPGDAQYAIRLGILLTYDPRSRAEGIRLLRAHPSDQPAQAALRKALIWDAANPASAAELRDYLKDHPQDSEIAEALKKNEATLAQINSGIARTPEERAAFAALNAHHLDVAERRFNAILAREPDNGRAAAGMGFLRMQQRNFGGAISYLTQAEQDGFKDKTIAAALASSRFWSAMEEATQALDQNQLDAAQEKFRAALAMNPRSADALNGLAGVYIKARQYAAAAQVEEQLIRLEPASLEGWRGLFLASVRGDENDKALALAARLPAHVKAALMQDPEFLGALASLYQAQGRGADAERVLAQALTLPFPGNGATLLAGTRLQYAGLLMEAKRYTQAAALYAQVLGDDPGDVSAWEGVISADHELGQDSGAIAAVQRMPTAAYETALDDSAFLSELAAIYQQANQYEVAEGLLERAEKLQAAAGSPPSIAIQLQLAGIDLVRNHTDQAYAMYRQVLTGHPDRADAWKGLIAALAGSNHGAQALEEIAQIPDAVRKQLETDIAFEQTEAGVYAASGDSARALGVMNRVQAYYARARQLPPPDVDVENCWLLYSTGSDRALYAALMRIASRSELTAAQRETVEDIWANWSVRRAAANMDNGYAQRAIDILDAAALAFPDNMTVRKAVAGGYARVGRAREALGLFKTVPMQDASAGDFEGAIGAALAADDKTQAEEWLRQALDRFAGDPAILTLAARYEQARGDNERAAAYYRASLAAMPQASPAERLAHVLVYPDADTKAHRAVTAADLRHLLDPDDEPFAKTTSLPPLPSYGPDPYSGAPPVVVPKPQPAQPPTPSGSAAPTSKNPPYPPVPHASLRDGRDDGPLPATPRLVLAAFGCKRPAARVRSDYVQLGLATPAAIQAAAESYSEIQISPEAPHSLASDAWKGLIFSLMTGNRDAEALVEISKIPPDVRRQLEADIGWVQGIASLYFAVGDTPRANLYLNRVESFYLLQRISAPANLEVQHAWLLYNLRNDVALYPVLERLDARSDLTSDQRRQLDALWADWAVRRANEALDAGRLLRALELLQAAAQDYPDNLSVKLAVAGAYARVGRAAEAVTLYKSIDLSSATPGDFRGAISAALTARDLAQAEAWLRVALLRFPSDSVVLQAAARFEQARGNTERASAFWRAALAAMPPGSSVKSLDYGLVSPANPTLPPAPGDTRRLLDPRLDPASPEQQAPQQLAPLSSYKSQTATALPLTAPAEPPPFSAPSGNPLPLPAMPLHPGDAQAGQGIAPVSTALAAVPSAGLRITSEPAGPIDAQAHNGLADQPTGELTSGSAALIHALPNASVGPMPSLQTPAAAAQLPSPQAESSAQGAYNAAQYTPSAQEAAAGASSGPKPRLSASAQPAAPPARTPAPRPRKNETPASPGQTLGNAHIEDAQLPEAPTPMPQSLPAAEMPQPLTSPAEGPELTTTTAGLSDEELELRSLPPLRGAWVRVQRQSNPPNPRDEAETELRQIESGFSGWLGGSTLLNYRSGDPGYSQMAAIESPFESSAPIGASGRITAVARPVFLDSGQANGNATMTVLEYQSGASCLVTIPEPIGTYAPSQNSTPCTSPSIGTLTPPPQQNAVGLGGELQLAFPHFAIAGGYTPSDFLVATFTGRFQWKPANGPVTISLVRDSVKDSQISYSGIRDPGQVSLSYPGQAWGGVVSNQGQVQLVRGDAQSGLYFSAGGQYLAGYNVESNHRIDGNGGAYWRVFASPENGALSLGANFFAMHYANNQNAFTHGMGGYFSPQGYFLANVPFTWSGHYLTHFHYSVMGALGAQAFQEDSTPLWPLVADKPLEISENNPVLPSVTSVSPNYDLRSEFAYQLGPHWFAGAYFAANNTRNYSFASVGFFVRFLLREQPDTATSPTGLFPWDGLRPFTVP
jgi:tetratricopeptide (TPR) repeat protein